MKTYKVSGTVTVSCWTEVAASSKEEAMQIAVSRNMADVIIDGGYPVDECWHLDSDGTPDNLKVED